MCFIAASPVRMRFGTMSIQIIERITPISSVLAKPRIVPVPCQSRTTAAISVVTLESMVLEKAIVILICL